MHICSCARTWVNWIFVSHPCKWTRFSFCGHISFANWLFRKIMTKNNESLKIYILLCIWNPLFHWLHSINVGLICSPNSYVIQHWNKLPIDMTFVCLPCIISQLFNLFWLCRIRINFWTKLKTCVRTSFGNYQFHWDKNLVVFCFILINNGQ